LLPTQAVPLQFFTHVSDRVYSTRFQALHVLPIGTRGAGTACDGVEGFLFLFLFLTMWRGFRPQATVPRTDAGEPYELSSLGNYGFPQSISLCSRLSFYFRIRLGRPASDGPPRTPLRGGSLGGRVPRLPGQGLPGRDTPEIFPDQGFPSGDTPGSELGALPHNGPRLWRRAPDNLRVGEGLPPTQRDL